MKYRDLLKWFLFKNGIENMFEFMTSWAKFINFIKDGNTLSLPPCYNILVSISYIKVSISFFLEQLYIITKIKQPFLDTISIRKMTDLFPLFNPRNYQSKILYNINIVNTIQNVYGWWNFKTQIIANASIKMPFWSIHLKLCWLWNYCILAFAFKTIKAGCFW